MKANMESQEKNCHIAETELAQAVEIRKTWARLFIYKKVLKEYLENEKEPEDGEYSGLCTYFCDLCITYENLLKLTGLFPKEIDCISSIIFSGSKSLLEAFVEFYERKPANVNIYGYWWDRTDKNIRIKIMKEIIEKTLKKIHDYESKYK